jgi:cytochrome c2
VHDDSRAGASDVYATGGAGLLDSTHRGSSHWLATILGLGAVVLTLAAGFVQLTSSPAMGSGSAGGTQDQIGKRPGTGSAAAFTPPEPGTPAADGRAIIGQKGCTGCHTIPGFSAGGNIGPNLSGVASRPKIAGGAVTNNGPEDLAKWVINPPADKPGTAMPVLGLTEDEANKVAAYLELLK